MKQYKIILAFFAIPALFASSAFACGCGGDKGGDDKKEATVLEAGCGGGCDKGDKDSKKEV